MKSVYLTIDDSPTAAFTQKVDYLLAKKIPAVFFCIGNLMEQFPEETIAAIKKGFVIANHSYTHPAFSSITVEQCIEEIEKTDQVIEDLYNKAEVSRPAKWFRFPYGDKGDGKKGRVFSRWRRSDLSRKKAIQQCLRKLGYTQPTFEAVQYNFMRKAGLYEDIDWSWTFDVMEWALDEEKPTQRLSTIEKVIARMQEKSPKDCRGTIGFEKRWLQSDSAEVILLHDHDHSTKYFNIIIDELLKMPITFSEVPTLSSMT